MAEDVERVRAATDLVVLVSEHVGLRRVGRRWVGSVPVPRRKDGFFLCQRRARPLLLFRLSGPRGRHFFPSGDRAPRLRCRRSRHWPAGPASSCATTARTAHDAADRRQRAAELGKAAGAGGRVVPRPLAARAGRGPGPGLLEGPWLRQRNGQTLPAGLGSRRVGRARPGGRVGEDMLVGAGLAYRNQAGRLNDSFRARVLFPDLRRGRTARRAWGAGCCPGRRGRSTRTPRRPSL